MIEALILGMPVDGTQKELFGLSASQAGNVSILRASLNASS
jgi:hypothetical protein